MNQVVQPISFEASILSLESICEQSSMEAFNPMAVPGMFRGLVKTVFDTLGFTSKFADVQDIEALPKDQEKFIRLIGSMPYTSIGELEAQTLEGLKVTWLELLAVLLPATDHVRTIQADLLDPYVAFLAQFVSDKKFSNDAFTDKRRLDQISKRTQASHASFGRLYSASYHARTRVSKVVSRNADWREIFKKTAQAIANLEAVDRDRVKAQIKTATDYIEIILGEFSKETDRKVSQEAAERLSRTSYVIARELEYYSTVYYRTLALRGAIENTMANIKQAIE